MHTSIMYGSVILLALSTSAIPIAHPNKDIAGSVINARTDPDEQQEIEAIVDVLKANYDEKLAIENSENTRRDSISPQDIQVISNVLRTKYDTANNYIHGRRSAENIWALLQEEEALEEEKIGAEVGQARKTCENEGGCPRKAVRSLDEVEIQQWIGDEVEQAKKNYDEGPENAVRSLDEAEIEQFIGDEIEQAKKSYDNGIDWPTKAERSEQ